MAELQLKWDTAKLEKQLLAVAKFTETITTAIYDLKDELAQVRSEG